MKFDCTCIGWSFVVIFLWANVTSTWGQDIHFSQFYNSPANLNPALTGIFGGDIRFLANYRSQWSSVPVDYRTLSAAFDSRLNYKILGKKAHLGYGFVFNNDVAGDAQIGISQVGANLAYTRQLGKSFFASLGVQFSVGQRSISPQKLTYEAQWNGDLHDPDLSSGEVFSATSKGLASISTGLNLHYQVEGTRTKIDIGTGIFHLNQPNTSFEGEPNTVLPLKFAPHFLSTFQLNPTLDIRANAQYSKQLSYQEVVASAAIRYHFNVERNSELNAQAGFSYRLNDAWIPTFELQYRKWTFGFSYDQNISPFKVATNRRGGPEFFLQHVIWKVHPSKEYKACPVF